MCTSWSLFCKSRRAGGKEEEQPDTIKVSGTNEIMQIQYYISDEIVWHEDAQRSCLSVPQFWPCCCGTIFSHCTRRCGLNLAAAAPRRKDWHSCLARPIFNIVVRMKILGGLHLGWEQYGGHIADRNEELTHSGCVWLRCTFEIDKLFLLLCNCGDCLHLGAAGTAEKNGSRGI